MSEYAIVTVGGRTGTWHEPADESTRDDPLPECHERYATDPKWATRRAELAADWYDRCPYCAGEFEAKTGRAILPSETEVAADD